MFSTKFNICGGNPHDTAAPVYKNTIHPARDSWRHCCWQDVLLFVAQLTMLRISMTVWSQEAQILHQTGCRGTSR